ncbi:MAG: phytanoyl-CoA dioxygenase family protein [Candidatus Omnitrophica bacterium]|nr:phytanoyl-CoA dioxygenase family protein [Candidatus Omnitrophota bacterium]
MRDVAPEDAAKVVTAFEKKGISTFRQVIDPDLIAEASAHVDWLLEKNPGVRPESLGHRLLRNDPFWLRLVSDPRLLDIAEVFIGPNIALFASHYISKPAGDGRPVLWHQDGSYWPLDPMEVVTLWLAVDDSTPENGCMRVVPGTHHTELQALVDRQDTPNVLGSGMEDGLVDESKAMDVVLKAGDVSVHHPNIIHGSNANTSTFRRCGLTIRYIPTTTRITAEEPWPSSFLLRGEAVSGVNHYHEFPKFIDGEHMPFKGCENWK